jgi:hypothetical protein
LPTCNLAPTIAIAFSCFFAGVGTSCALVIFIDKDIFYEEPGKFKQISRTCSYRIITLKSKRESL